MIKNIVFQKFDCGYFDKIQFLHFSGRLQKMNMVYLKKDRQFFLNQCEKILDPLFPDS